MEAISSNSLEDSLPVTASFLLRREGLPYPWVHYPGGYYKGSQTFIGFSEEEQSAPVLCECSRVAVENAILHQGGGTLTDDGSKWWHDPWFTGRFPLTMQVLFPKNKHRHDRPGKVNPYWNDVGGWFRNRFRIALCHRCNLATPTVRYAKFGGAFEQLFGWYVEQTRFSLGAIKLKVFEDRCPPEIKEIWEKIDGLMPEWHKLLKAAGEADAKYGDEQHPDRLAAWASFKPLDIEIKRLHRAWEKIPENLTREEFGFCKIGEHNVSESMLYGIVKRVLSKCFAGECEIIRNHRPSWLGGLELDIHCPSLKLAFEYNGQQHYRPIEAWGGSEALARQQENDHRKAYLCDADEVTLVVIKYTEPLSESHVLQRLRETSWYARSSQRGDV